MAAATASTEPSISGPIAFGSIEPGLGQPAGLGAGRRIGGGDAERPLTAGRRRVSSRLSPSRFAKPELLAAGAEEADQVALVVRSRGVGDQVVVDRGGEVEHRSTTSRLELSVKRGRRPSADLR